MKTALEVTFVGHERNPTPPGPDLASSTAIARSTRCRCRSPTTLLVLLHGVDPRAARITVSASAPRRPHPPASGDGHRRREGERGRRRARISPPPPPSPDLRGAAVRQGLVRRDGMPWKPQPCPRTRRRSHRPRPHPTRRRSTQRERTERLRERGRPALV